MWVDTYPTDLNTEGDPADAQAADSLVYRLACERMPVPGLPDQVSVGAATVYFAQGPIRTQITRSRQRPGLPFAFDKHMRRAVDVGDGTPLTICEITAAVPADLGAALLEWRDMAEAALGLLCATLDERVVGKRGCRGRDPVQGQGPGCGG